MVDLHNEGVALSPAPDAYRLCAVDEPVGGGLSGRGDDVAESNGGEVLILGPGRKSAAGEVATLADGRWAR